MNSDYPLQATPGRTHEAVVLRLFLTTAVEHRVVEHHLETRRTGLRASHAGVADVPSTPDQLSQWCGSIWL